MQRGHQTISRTWPKTARYINCRPKADQANSEKNIENLQNKVGANDRDVINANLNENTDHRDICERSKSRFLL
jgi:hypothetical protein